MFSTYTTSILLFNCTINIRPSIHKTQSTSPLPAFFNLNYMFILKLNVNIKMGVTETHMHVRLSTESSDGWRRDILTVRMFQSVSLGESMLEHTEQLGHCPYPQGHVGCGFCPLIVVHICKCSPTQSVYELPLTIYTTSVRLHI